MAASPNDEWNVIFQGRRLQSCNLAGPAGRADGSRKAAMNELISMLPWAFGLVAAAAALTQFR
jgi:hypothetical protein